MLNGSAKLLNRKEDCYSSVKISCYYPPLGDSKSVRKFYISEIVITTTFCKDLLEILPGTISKILHCQCLY